MTGCRLCGPRADTLAERRGRSRPGSLEIRQSKAENDVDPARLVMAAPSTAIGSYLVVRGPGQAPRRLSQEDNDCRARPQAARRVVEIRQRRRRHRGRDHEDRLMRRRRSSIYATSKARLKVASNPVPVTSNSHVFGLRRRMVSACWESVKSSPVCNTSSRSVLRFLILPKTARA